MKRTLVVGAVVILLLSPAILGTAQGSFFKVFMKIMERFIQHSRQASSTNEINQNTIEEEKKAKERCIGEWSMDGQLYGKVEGFVIGILEKVEGIVIPNYPKNSQLEFSIELSGDCTFSGSVWIAGEPETASAFDGMWLKLHHGKNPIMLSGTWEGHLVSIRIIYR